ncbi:hypothetical protein CPJCM30710_10980 [Clostridium polyendosporum]|uniref:Uncharacterized protein n=1 Tax=Clostridium polyendosporum TaxID=69208 RepID=A0A919RY54_9CLOT|nr:hypothetical protein [Clostridium polyendosporum]GIM28432.1 hypothetical protein CPJCM30710_10980 [Clostridium polyendosporum]
MKKDEEIKKLVNENIGLVIDNIRLYHEDQRLNERLEVTEHLERGLLNRRIILDEDGVVVLRMKLNKALQKH